MGENELLIDGALYRASSELAAEHLLKTLSELQRIGITPVVFSPTPQNGKNIGECLVRSEFFGFDSNICNFSQDSTTENSKKVYDFLNNIAKKNNVVFVDEGICSNGLCQARARRYSEWVMV